MGETVHGRVARAARALGTDLVDAMCGSGCPGCGRALPRGLLVCEACDAAVGRSGVALCLRCLCGNDAGGAAPPPRPGACPRHGADRILLAGPAHEPPLDRIVRAYKYDGARALQAWLAPLLPEPPGGDALRRELVLVPVPLHPARLAWRGFDQTRLLAEAAGRAWGIPVVDALRRVRDRPPQARLDKDARRENVRGAFEACAAMVPLLRGRPILLVDDVATTGSTLLEAASAAASSGPSWILSLAVTHGGLPGGSETPSHVEVAAPERL